MIAANQTNAAHYCNYIFKDSSDTSFASSSRIGRFGYDKLSIDITMGEMLYKDLYRNLGSVLYLRNVSYGLTVSGNTFQESVYTSGAIMVEGMINTAGKIKLRVKSRVPDTDLFEYVSE